MNDLTPKIRTEGRNGVDPNLIFGLDSKLFEKESEQPLESHHDEVETVTIYKGSGFVSHNHLHDHEHHSHQHHEVTQESCTSTEPLREDTLRDALSKLSKEIVWRVKGFVRTEKGIQILNWAFGRYDLMDFASTDVLSDLDVVKLTVMGERGEVKRAGRRLAEALGGRL